MRGLKFFDFAHRLAKEVGKFVLALKGDAEAGFYFRNDITCADVALLRDRLSC